MRLDRADVGHDELPVRLERPALRPSQRPERRLGQRNHGRGARAQLEQIARERMELLEAQVDHLARLGQTLD
jgi:hypothetical protein